MRHIALFFMIALLLLACDDVSSDLPQNPVGSGDQPLPPVALPTPVDAEVVTVQDVVDGDTIRLSNGRSVRYIGINTPERGQPFYEDASQINEQLLASGQQVRIERDVESLDKYGRILAYVWVGDTLANLEIVRQGYANTFTVPPNVRYQDILGQAEQEAKAAKRGLWAESISDLKIIHIEANAPGNDRENPNGEWIEIVNQSDRSISMDGFTLKDAANHIYTFEGFSARPQRSFKIYSGTGADSGFELYWGNVGDSVWNNDSDSAFLRDAEGALIDSYGY